MDVARTEYSEGSSGRSLCELIHNSGLYEMFCKPLDPPIKVEETNHRQALLSGGHIEQVWGDWLGLKGRRISRTISIW